MAVPDLPPELVTLILEDLYEPPPSTPPDEPSDKSNLRACRLVCRSWATLAAEQLFRAIYVSFCPSVEDAWQMVDGLYPPLRGRWMRDHHGKKWPLKTLEGFREFFASRDDLRSHVRWVLLRGYTSDAWDADKREVSAQLFVEIVNMLPRLHVLHLTNVSISNSALIAGHEPYRVARTLGHLTIRYPYEPWANTQLARLLRRFAAVDELQLPFDAFGEDGGEELVAAQAAPLAVRVLRVAGHDGSFLRDLRPLLDLGKLRKLSMCDPPTRETFAATQNFIYASSALEHLCYTFSLATLMYHPDIVTVPDLSRSTSLKSANFGIARPIDGFSDSPDSDLIGALATLLKNARFESLGAYKLVLRIRRKSMRSLQDGSKISPLNGTLDDMRRRWNALKEIWIMCEKEEDEHARTSIAGQVRFLLPQPSMNCVLRVLFAQQPMELPPIADLIVTRL
ncbi:F-box protein [Phanerochaete sordida]|uniref:F-box protein n=1 Tax=Phanerochaete sordida TaxID=48140 RepID=A0A9P3G3I4_9APHY|nr:F-box protein [Phanerochaete sordida]